MAMTVSMLAAEKGISVSPLQMAEAPTIAGLVKVGVGVGVAGVHVTLLGLNLSTVHTATKILPSVSMA